MNTDLHFSTGNDEHDTPRGFFEPIANAVGGFDLDPSASSTSDLAETNWTKDDDGLPRDWFGKVWCNPPYSEIRDWMGKMADESDRDDVDLIVGLAYGRTSTRWFHESGATADMICWVKGRLTFAGSEHAAPAPSVVFVWGDSIPNALEKHLADIGVLAGGAD